MIAWLQGYRRLHSWHGNCFPGDRVWRLALVRCEEFPTVDSFAGNRFYVPRRSRWVVDLDCVLESRWPPRCLHLHKFSCPESYDESRHYKRRPRQPNDVDMTDLLRRLREYQDDQQQGQNLGWSG